MLAVGVHICWLTYLEHAYIIGLSAGTLAANKAYMSADTLGACIYYMAISCMLAVGVHICRLTCLEHAYIICPLAGTLSAGVIYVS